MPASDIVEAQWQSVRRGPERFRAQQPTYSILNRGIETEVLPVAQRYGLGTLVWSPLAKGMLTGRIRKGQQTDLKRAAILTSFTDEQRLDAVEQIVGLADDAGLPMTHLAMAFAIARLGVTSAIIGPRTMEQPDDLLAGVDVNLSDEILDRIDAIVPPARMWARPTSRPTSPWTSSAQAFAAVPLATAPQRKHSPKPSFHSPIPTPMSNAHRRPYKSLTTTSRGPSSNYAATGLAARGVLRGHLVVAIGASSG